MPARYLLPAMDEEMWQQPAVQENIEWLKTKGVKFIEPVKGALAKAALPAWAECLRLMKS